MKQRKLIAFLLILLVFVSLGLIIQPKKNAVDAVKTSKNLNTNVEKGQISGRYNFDLYTTAIKTNNNFYEFKTYGKWNKRFIFGLERYPSFGYDYIIVKIPDEFKIEKNKLDYNFTGKRIGNSKKIFDRDNIIAFQIEDDPLGYSQLDDFCLTITCTGKSKDTLREIDSYYIHTWNENELLKSSLSKNKEFKMKKNNNYWQLYSSCSFRF